ncbi:MAG: Rrf2 family transcriptional regulator [Dehalococcoidales bacterium]|nr:Rrf2 family transcriptional regulator [Dehalococcoidales bacterium]
MKLSTRGRYGTKVLLDLAMYQGAGPVSLKDISQRQQIPLHYLEHLIAPLITGGIIRSSRGAKGGIALVKTPAEVRLSEVIPLLEGSIAPAECVANPELCGNAASCVTRDVWREMENAMTGVLEGITLQNLADRQRSKEQPKEKMYYI